MTLAKKFIYQTILIGSALSFALGVNYLYAWTGPTGVAPNNNVSAPLNIGTNAQVKDGNVSVGASANGLTTLGLSVYGAQYIKGWLKVGNTGTPTQLLELSGTSGVDGIKFPDGTVQTSAGGGAVVKIANAINTATAAGSSAIPYDDTIPQITEGTEFMTMSYTPTSATNNLLVQVVFNGAPEAGAAEDGPFTVALFKDAVTSALAAVSIESYDFEVATYAIPLTYIMAAGTTNPITFRIRAGTNAAGNYRFNGIGGVRKLGGVMASTITVTEFKP